MYLDENDRIGGRRPVKKNTWFLKNLAVVTLISTATAGLIIVFDNPDTVFSGPLTPLNKFVVKRESKPSAEPAYEQRYYYPSPEHIAAIKANTEKHNQLMRERERERQRQSVYLQATSPARKDTGSPEQSKEARQTVFNENNYQPTGAINTVKMQTPRYNQYQQSARSNSSNRETVTRNHEVYWHWPSVQNNRKGERGYFYYKEVNGKIDTRPICSNFKKGSLIYRDCRKAAKKYFNDNCSTHNRAACTASNMAP